MFDLSTLGRWLMIAGIGVILVGGLLFLLGKVPFWGQLPGDIRIQTGRFSCFVPIVSSLLISLVLTILLNLVIHLLNKR